MNRLIKSGAQAIEHASNWSGRPNDPPGPDEIKELRKSLGLTQQEFSSKFYIDLNLLKSWETGRRVPSGSSALLLHLIAKDPKLISRCISEMEQAPEPA